ncbi:MAG TPA: CAP domain-containing protein [Gemmataceae bacterium]|jgi:uncharacterized protein YkwD|nr:CAP domain-containing protein [Gemmataceae bacterium]
MRSPLVVLLLIPALAVAQPKAKEFKLSEDEQGVLDATNAERKAEGLPPLKPNPKLFAAARAHSENMAKQSKLDHVLDEKTPADRVKAAGYAFRMVGENVEHNAPTPAEAVKDWMNSPGHKANILNKDFTEIGIAVARNDKGEPYWTQVFARPR